MLLYELLTGQVPFGASPRSVVLARQTSEPPPAPRSINPKLPVAVEQLLLRALAKRPDERYQSAGDMAADLKRLNAQAWPAAVSETEAGTEIVLPSSPTSSLGWAPLVLVLAILVVFSVVGLLARREAPAAEPPLHATGKVVLSDAEPSAVPMRASQYESSRLPKDMRNVRTTQTNSDAAMAKPGWPADSGVHLQRSASA